MTERLGGAPEFRPAFTPEEEPEPHGWPAEDYELPVLDPAEFGGTNVEDVPEGQEGPAGSSTSGYNGNEAFPPTLV